MKPWIQTYTGRKFDLIDPQPEDVCIEDIAHALSNLCRFTGHVRHRMRSFYSVAQHSVLVSKMSSPLQGLLHDATEAYIGDLSSPLKAILPEYRVIEYRIWEVVADRFNLPALLPDCVKLADAQMLADEADQLLGDAPECWGLPCQPRCREDHQIVPWTRKLSKEAFLRRYRDCVI